MQFDTQTLMLLFFLLLLAVSIWKISAFLPNKPLADDDSSKESNEELLHLILKVIAQNNGKMDSLELFKQIQEDEDFDSKRFWRFNQNRVNQLLQSYYLQNAGINSIEDIYKASKA
ncbi:MAG: hypothetical protein PHU40_04525 [Sulfurimonas sp.]|jgi:hypothetical protein|nr:hypothetical protein [Sulfurimonas sp.]